MSDAEAGGGERPLRVLLADDEEPLRRILGRERSRGTRTPPHGNETDDGERQDEEAHDTSS